MFLTKFIFVRLHELTKPDHFFLIMVTIAQEADVTIIGIGESHLWLYKAVSNKDTRGGSQDDGGLKFFRSFFVFLCG